MTAERAAPRGYAPRVTYENEVAAAQLAYWNGPAGDRWATSWQMFDRAEAAISEAILARAAPAAGERVLDVGCGAGTTTLALRERVGAGGAVTGIDVSAPQLAVARARAAGTDVAFVEADAAACPFRPEHDLVFSRFGVMFFADPERAFANLRAAAAPGGRLAFVCWRSAGENGWVTVPMDAARALAPEVAPPPPGEPGPFAFADRDRLHGILARAGWQQIAIERADHAMVLGSTAEEAAHAALVVGPLARSIAELSADTRARILERLIEAMTPFVTPDGVALPTSCWLDTARA
jgi:SAM-dependent methyltransferase